MKIVVVIIIIIIIIIIGESWCLQLVNCGVPE